MISSTRIRTTLLAGERELSLLVNDLSIHGQFLDLVTFRGAIERLMEIREIARRFGQELHCHKGMMCAQVMPAMTMPQAIQALTINEQRALRSWITQNGPFWEEARNHSPDDWLECRGDIVTDTAVGEAAWCCLNSIDRELISLIPSNWQFSPVLVEWTSSFNAKKTIDVVNHWDPISLEAILKAAPIPIVSWDQLATLTMAQCPLLTFATDAFSPLNGHPFVSGAAQRLLSIVDTLNRFKSCFNAEGQRTPEGNEIYQDFFTGLKGDGGRGAIFTDSSDREMTKFKKEMTFKHPGDPSKTLFCSMHGKVQTPQLRVHFSWPVRHDEPLYIVYIGPKLTKQ